jgi:cytochrome c oxidase subunit 2
MDKYEIRVIIMGAFLMSVFVFAILYSNKVRKIDVPECIPYDGAFQNPKVIKRDSLQYDAHFVAGMWSFEPAEVYLPVGAELDLYLTSKDVVHGFHIEKKGLNMMAVPGGINKQTLKFDKAGIYRIVCHEYCGTGHQNMMSEIIVNDH